MVRPLVSTAVSCADALISLASAIVPRGRRDEWRREWRGELHHRARHVTRQPDPRRRDVLGLVARAAGSIIHALWLRVHDWSLVMIWLDLRHAARLLWRNPGFAAVAGVTLALGIGATTAMATVAYAVLLRPLPYAQPDRLVQIWEHNPIKGWTDNIVAPANLLDWRARNRSLTGIAAYYGTVRKNASISGLALTGSGEPELLRSLGVSNNLFEVLGVAPAVGRTFSRRDADDAPLVVLSDGLWRRRFGARSEIVGRAITLDDKPYTVVGVMPPGFYFPERQVELWGALGLPEAQQRTLRRPHFLRTIARLEPGVSVDAARADLVGIARQLEREYPDTNTKMGVDVGAFQAWMVSDVRRTLLLFLAAVAGVLLIACANVANLLLARASGRTRELAVRSALGAGRGRLIRQLLVESLLLALVGAAAGLALTAVALRSFVALAPAGIPRLDQIAPDLSTLTLALLIAVVTTLLCGLLPAIHATRGHVEPALRDGDRAGGSPRASRTRASLVIAEVALAVALVVGAGLLLRSFAALQRVDTRLDRDRVLTVRLSLSDARYPKPADVAAWYSRLFDRLGALPGVIVSGASTQLPLTGARWTGDMTIEGRSPDDYGVEIRHKEITPAYFEAAGLTMVDGRPFEASDTSESPPVVIVNQALARRYFAATPAVGQRITFAKPTNREAPWRTIVGVVEDEPQDGLDRPAQPEVFESVLQNPQDTMSVVVRTSVPPESMAGPVLRVIRELDPLLVPSDVRSMNTVIGASLQPARFSTLLVTACGAVALLLAMGGVYSVVSYGVARRGAEFGLRMALGATRRDLLGLIVRRELWPVAIGLVLGITLAYALSQLLTTYLFEVSPTDAGVFAGVTALLGATAAGAALVPALRATRVDPLSMLRADS